MAIDRRGGGTASGDHHGGGPRLTVKPPRLVLGSDLRETLLVGLSALTAATRPVERWAATIDKFHKLDRGTASKRFDKFSRQVAAVYGADPDKPDVAELWQDWQIAHHRRRMLIVAKRVRRDHPLTIRFGGREKLEAALRAGAGAILWFDNFLHHPLVGKYPFADAGFVSWQLSSSSHGFSRSQFGHSVLNPIQHAVESQLVAKRIVFDGQSALAATREVKALLADNKIVRITNNAFIGRRFARVPFGAAARLPVATTPLNLARSTGAALLPVSVIETDPFTGYAVTVGDPIAVSAADKDEALHEASCDYARYLEPLVRAHPEQWMSWSSELEQAGDP